MEQEFYSTSQAAKLFGYSRESMRAWAIEFADYLSPTANPTPGQHRLFTREDMSVFALVNDMKSENHEHDVIHTALKSGQRGQMPDIDPADIAADIAENAALAARRKDDQILILQRHLSEMKEENIRLEERLRERNTQALNIEQANAQLRAEINRLHREIGKLEAQIGFLKDQSKD